MSFIPIWASRTGREDTDQGVGTPVFTGISILPEEAQEILAHKAQDQGKGKILRKCFMKGIWEEFGKVVCVSVGFFLQTREERTFRVHSYTGGRGEPAPGVQGIAGIPFWGATVSFMRP